MPNWQVIRILLQAVRVLMQATCYTLPHQHKEWAQAQKHLRAALAHEKLEDVIKQIKHINEDSAWSTKTLAGLTFSDEQLVSIFKFAAECCLQVQSLFPDGLPISRPIQKVGVTSTILTKRQALCLVANMFFCTTRAEPKLKNLPVYYSFTRLSRRPNEITKTVLNYFERCFKRSKELDDSNIVFFRIAETLPFESWRHCEEKLCEVRFHSQGCIQDMKESIQIDFANKSIGGFFLSETYTQEDIIFVNNPELMPALLFHQYMQPNECILMVGAERFSSYTGYLETYKFAGNFNDDREQIELKMPQDRTVMVKNTWISAIDAIPYFITSQFNQDNLNRELNKAYVGFNINKLDGGHKPISTGNWGSGAFNGNLEYKFLIQWLAASRANRTLDYFSFSDKIATGIPEIIQKFKHLTVRELLELMTLNAQKFHISKRVFKILLHTK